MLGRGWGNTGSNSGQHDLRNESQWLGMARGKTQSQQDKRENKTRKEMEVPSVSCIYTTGKILFNVANKHLIKFTLF